MSSGEDSKTDYKSGKSSSSESIDNIVAYGGFDDNAEAKVKELARTLTNQSASRLERRQSYISNFSGTNNDAYSRGEAASNLIRTLTSMSQVPGESPFEGEIDPRLNPESDEFSSRFWVKNMRKLMDSDPDHYKPASLGIAYKNLRAYGDATDADYQATVSNMWGKYFGKGVHLITDRNDKSRQFDILKSMDGLIKAGEVTVVLGRPGSGCSTLLKTLSSHTYGFHVAPESEISYDGLGPNDITKNFRGEVIYSAETDVHFPQLSVGDTLAFAARLKTPQNRAPGVDRETYATHMTDVTMATYGLSHTKNTQVGNDFIRGVSGGERKRVSIAEVTLCGASIQCWDNATRGLDAATALEFIKALKTSATILDATPLIAIYQCSQDAYDLFDNVVLLYEGYQIFFGKSEIAKDFFVRMGYDCPQRQTTADYLTSLTNPAERIVRAGYEDKVPKSPKEFEAYWKNSPEYEKLIHDIDTTIDNNHKMNAKQDFHDAHVAKQSKHLRPGSPYTVSYGMQVKYLFQRNILRVKGDASITLFSVFGNVGMSLILASMFYNLQETTESFYFRTAAMFISILFNAFSSLLEIMALFQSRPIVEKHKTYSLYHPSADAFSSIFLELFPKVLTCIAFNLIFYFLVNFSRSPGRFFFYLLVNFTATIAMSHLFRTIGAATKSLSEAMTPASVLLLALVIFTGFVIPTPKMLGWSRWINYLDPVGYAFEALISNEFHGRNFTCSAFVPQGAGYENVGADNQICSTTGVIPGTSIVSGDLYINASFDYYNEHKWRDWGIVVVFAVFFLFVYVTFVEYNKGAMQKGEILLFQKSSLQKMKKEKKQLNATEDPEANYSNELKTPVEQDGNESTEDNRLPHSEDIFHWRDLTYQVQIKKEDRVILNDVNGWVKPGQLTALMGASGAGKTTLLNALSDRLTSGVITSGVRMVNGHALDDSFQRSTGYVQQQDLHLQTSTVREALRFSAYLRQPASVSMSEKNSYVEYIIDLLEMSKYADAVVGVAGEGLNVEQRKRLTIGVELVAKPKLLLFLDEPTSGLDSQTAWSICKLMRKLADHGQAILCTIHQPSAILLKEFDRLLFLQKGGQTVYFGDLGENCTTLIDYFEKYGAPACPSEANPAEWMLEVIGAAPGSHAIQNYYDVWKNSTEFHDVQKELDVMEQELVKKPMEDSEESKKKFAASLPLQYYVVTKRVFEQYWRSPSYIMSKFFLCVFSSLFNGFSFFKADKSLQGLQNQMFAVFMFLVVFNTLVQQMLPYYVAQRDLYEARERPSRTFSWVAFITAQITVEIPWQILVGTASFFCWYYPVGLYENAVPTDNVHQRGALMWLYIVCFFIYTSTMGQLCISFNELADNAANLSSLLFTMCLNFCGVLAGPGRHLPGFWIFMYRFNPFTYLVQGILAIGLADSSVVCATEELLHFTPTDGQTCGAYMKTYMDAAGGYLIDELATDGCEFCTIGKTNVFLASVGAEYSQIGRNIGIFIGFIIFNMLGTVLFYYLARVPRGSRQKK